MRAHGRRQADGAMMTPQDAHYIASQDALREAHEQTAKLKRRLRQYAHTLDAVSARAREEVASAVEARNDARAHAAKAECRADDYADEVARLRAALAESRARHESLASQLEQANTRAVNTKAQADAMRVELSRIRSRAKDADRRRAERDSVLAQKDAELFRVQAALSTAKQERDTYADEARSKGAELQATQRELAIVRHQLETRAPPEITKAVRSDIGEYAARAVERRAMCMLRAIAEHYAAFPAKTRPKLRERAAREEEVVEEDAELPVEKLPMPAVERLLDLSSEPEDDLQDIRDAEDVLREHLEVIRRMVSITEQETDPADIIANAAKKGGPASPTACENKEPQSAAEAEPEKRESQASGKVKTVRFQEVRRDQLALARN